MKLNELITVMVLTLALPLSARMHHGLRDEQGRHVIARGFVVNTNDGKYDLTFNADDYLRMVRLGANFQVIRLQLGKLRTYPECRLEPAYLDK